MSRRSVISFLILLAVAGAAAAEHERGVTLFRDANYQGFNQTFSDGDEVPGLGELPIGNDAVSSVKVEPGCRVTLYEHAEFRGESITLSEDVAMLGYTRIGNDSVTSIQVECRGRYGSGYGRPGYYGGGRGDGRRPGYYDPPSGYGHGHGRDGGYGHGHDGGYGHGHDGGHGHGHGYDDWGERGGVALYTDADFRGRQEVFYDDDPRLSDNAIRQDSVSSVRVAPGCSVILYEHSDFRGNATLLDYDTPSLRGSQVGNDRVSSIEVRCRRRPEGVTLYQHADFEGRYETFVEDDPYLRDNPVCQDRVSSVHVSPGCVVTLYEHTDFRGRSTTLREDTPNLRLTWVGNDTVSSIRVDCRRYGWRR